MLKIKNVLTDYNVTDFGFSDRQGPDVIGNFPMDRAVPASSRHQGGPSIGSATVLYDPGSGSLARAGGAGTPSLGTTPVTSTSSTSGPVFNITWDFSVSSAPTGFTAGVTAAANYLASQYSDAVTINISVGFGEVNGTALGSNALGQSLTYLTSVAYTTLTNALKADAKTATDTGSVATLPVSAPGTMWTTTAEAKALGLASATGTSTDGYCGFSSSLLFDYNNSDGVTPGTYDFYGVVLHEFTEVMGRMLLTGGTIGTTANSFAAYDLFHFSAPGVHTYSASAAGYFSADNGTTSLNAFNTASGGDAGDWASSAGNDAGNAFSNSGVVNAFTTPDLIALDTIGWDRVVPASAGPTGVAYASVVGGLASIATASGLAANTVIATATQTGGNSADSFTYTLGGTGAASFSLSSTGVLSTGASGVAGASNGTLSGLTVTANDTTTALSSPAVPLNLVVGSAGSDTVSLATLAGSASTATPTFIYGLAGNDSINGTGMTGKLWFDGGAGADTMTGGSGPNSFLYGAASESTASVMDIVGGFHAATDTIDLRGLGGHTLSFAGKLSVTRLAAYSVGYQASGGNTFVYVNTSGSSEALASTNMKIELLGSVSLTSSNILHV